MKTGKTNQSANLRTGPNNDYPIIDQLEPGYPLMIRSDGADGWLEVIAKAQGKRTKDQRGWIGSQLVTIDGQPERPKPPDAGRTILYVAAVGIIMFLALLAWL